MPARVMRFFLRGQRGTLPQQREAHQQKHKQRLSDWPSDTRLPGLAGCIYVLRLAEITGFPDVLLSAVFSLILLESQFAIHGGNFKMPDTITIPPTADPGTGLVTVNVYDGTRQLIPAGAQILFTIVDGAQKQLFRDFVAGPSQTFSLPFHNNADDNCSIIAFADGYQQAGFQPVTINPAQPATLDLMLLPKNGSPHFAHAQWADLQAQKPLTASIFAASATGDPGAAYTALMEAHPNFLACLLNITTAMQQIFLPHNTVLDYFKLFDLPNLAPDRIFGWVDATLEHEVQLAEGQGEFVAEAAIDLALHGDATSSYKQIQFGEANVQLTFHGTHHQTIGGVDCVYIEPDIDYFEDPVAHLFGEVIPNTLTGTVSDPRVVYVLRWIAGQQAGIPNFDPLYTIE